MMVNIIRIADTIAKVSILCIEITMRWLADSLVNDSIRVIDSTISSLYPLSHPLLSSFIVDIDVSIKDVDK